MTITIIISCQIGKKQIDNLYNSWKTVIEKNNKKYTKKSIKRLAFCIKVCYSYHVSKKDAAKSIKRCSQLDSRLIFPARESFIKIFDKWSPKMQAVEQ